MQKSDLISETHKISYCRDGEQDYICGKLVEYNLSKVKASQDVLFEDINKKIVDKDGKIIAGCVARMYCWNILYIDILWVEENYRNYGFGKRLLFDIEKTAREKGCYLVHLDTFDFQALGFYEKLGYEIFGKLDDCPQNHCRYFLKKYLT